MSKQITINTQEEFKEWAQKNKEKYTYRKTKITDRISIGFFGKTIFNIPFDLSDYLIKYFNFNTKQSDKLSVDIDIIFTNIEFNQGLSIHRICFTGNLSIEKCTSIEFSFHNCDFNYLNISLGIISNVFEIAECTSYSMNMSKMRTTSDTYLRIINSEFHENFSIDHFILQGWGEIHSVIGILSVKNLILDSNFIIDDDSQIECANWETACILKNEELKRNNFVKALEYQSIEKDLYEYVLNNQLSNKAKCLIRVLFGVFLPLTLPLYGLKKLVTPKELPTQDISPTDKSSFTILLDWLSLWLSKVTNNHNQNWGLGITFTLIVWVVCFGMFYLPFPYQDIHYHIFTVIYWKNIITSICSGKFFSLMLDYINPTEYKLLKYYVTNSQVFFLVKWGGTFWFLLGKALVPYGVVEVVKAFRKYNKID